ncbi:UDP-glucuronosyltransferase 2A1-like [Elysia marginata]|uniref:UDP-glucuronosyltransferase 2A1-like n=1 Tax=Elysia marginata TaxID=1093978 RepID=A0AAV4HEC5_9GAST|nr:UDP-glucuronosyltransferase 2A1-like [Elysia marginata]
MPRLFPQMVRNFKKKETGSRRNFSQCQDMVYAYNAVMNQEMSLNQAARYYNGFTPEEIKDVVKDFVAAKNIETPLKDGPPGYDWLTNFLKRHPDIAPQSTERARAEDPEVLNHWFELLDNVLTKSGIKDMPAQIFNTDETGIVTDPKSDIVLAARGAKRVNQSIGGSGREQITVNCAASASAHMTHHLQPLDRAVFRPVKQKWQSMLVVVKFAGTHNGPVGKKDFPKMLKTLVEESFKPETIKAGFSSTGICPFNNQAVVLDPAPQTTLATPSTSASPAPPALPSTSTITALYVSIASSIVTALYVSSTFTALYISIPSSTITALYVSSTVTALFASFNVTALFFNSIIALYFCQKGPHTYYEPLTLKVKNELPTVQSSICLANLTESDLTHIWAFVFALAITADHCKIPFNKVFNYGCKAWTYSKTVQKKTQTFEIRCYRRLLKVPWTEKKNKEIIQMANVGERLLQQLMKRKLGYAGHIMRSSSGPLLQLSLEGKIEGKGGKGRPRRNWTDDVKEWSGSTSYGDTKRKAENREE